MILHINSGKRLNSWFHFNKFKLFYQKYKNNEITSIDNFKLSVLCSLSCNCKSVTKTFLMVVIGLFIFLHFSSFWEICKICVLELPRTRGGGTNTLAVVPSFGRPRKASGWGFRWRTQGLTAQQLLLKDLKELFFSPRSELKLYTQFLYVPFVCVQRQ